MTARSYTLPGSHGSDEGTPRPQKQPSLTRRALAGDLPARPPKPRPFDMTEPFQQPGGVWAFWLTADEPLIRYAYHINCVMPLPGPSLNRPQVRGRVLLGINPRYDHDEAWLWIFRMLSEESETVELDAIWETALEDDSED